MVFGVWCLGVRAQKKRPGRFFTGRAALTFASEGDQLPNSPLAGVGAGLNDATLVVQESRRIDDGSRRHGLGFFARSGFHGRGRGAAAAGATGHDVASGIAAALALQATEQLAEQTSTLRLAGHDFATAGRSGRAAVDDFGTASGFASDIAAGVTAAFATEQFVEQTLAGSCTGRIANDFRTANRPAGAASGFSTASGFASNFAAASGFAAGAASSFSAAGGFASDFSAASGFAGAASGFGAASRLANNRVAAGAVTTAALETEHTVEQIEAKALGADARSQNHDAYENCTFHGATSPTLATGSAIVALRTCWIPDGRGRNRWTKSPPIEPRRAG